MCKSKFKFISLPFLPPSLFMSPPSTQCSKGRLGIFTIFFLYLIVSQQILWTCPWNIQVSSSFSCSTHHHHVMRCNCFVTACLQSQLPMIHPSHCQNQSSKTQMKAQKCPAENPAMILYPFKINFFLLDILYHKQPPCSRHGKLYARISDTIYLKRNSFVFQTQKHSSAKIF